MEDILYSYPARYYDLTKLSALHLRPMEIGRLCVDQHTRDPFLLLIAFKYIQSIVSSRRVDFIFGCTSFAGADNPQHLAALNSLEKTKLPAQVFQLKENHLKSWISKKILSVLKRVRMQTIFCLHYLGFISARWKGL